MRKTDIVLVGGFAALIAWLIYLAYVTCPPDWASTVFSFGVGLVVFAVLYPAIAFWLVEKLNRWLEE